MYLIGGLALALLIAIGFGGCEHKRANGLEAQISANKIIAKQMLDTAVAQGKADSIQSQKDYDDALKTLSIANRNYAGQLRDPGRRPGCPSSPAPDTGVPQEAPTGGELSPELGKFLRSEADRADIAATYALKCQQYAIKPSIRSQVENLK